MWSNFPLEHLKKFILQFQLSLWPEGLFSHVVAVLQNDISVSFSILHDGSQQEN